MVLYWSAYCHHRYPDMVDAAERGGFIRPKHCLRSADRHHGPFCGTGGTAEEEGMPMATQTLDALGDRVERLAEAITV